jgi:hypothetical protein
MMPAATLPGRVMVAAAATGIMMREEVVAPARHQQHAQAERHEYNDISHDRGTSVQRDVSYIRQ